MDRSFSDSIERTLAAVAGSVFAGLLRFYPHDFSARFGSEMKAVFQQALAEQVRRGWLHGLAFFLRELIDAPGSILCQHLAAKPVRFGAFPANILAFGLGFGLVGLVQALTSSWTPLIPGAAGYFLYLGSFVVAGGLGGAALGYGLDRQRIGRFVLAGATGLLITNTLGNQMYLRVFPTAYQSAQSGGDFLIAFLYPFLSGCVLGLFFGLATGEWVSLLRFTAAGGLAMLAGFIANRLSAALMQSYFTPGAFSGVAPDGSAWFFVYGTFPFLLEGMLFGLILGKIHPGQTRKGIAV